MKRKTAETVAIFVCPAAEIDIGAVPKLETDALCRCLIRSARKAFENPEFAAEYETWLRKRRENQATQTEEKSA